MDDEELAKLEHAAQIIMGASNEVGNDQRRAAEALFLNFRKTRHPYEICQQILEKSQVDYVKFEAAETLKCAIIREWALLDSEYIVGLRQYLLNYVRQNQVAFFVEDRILKVIAVMIKRGSVSDHGQERGNFLSEVENEFGCGDTTKQILHLKLIEHILQEYANTDKSTNVGLIWEIHCKVKKQFESEDLQRIFRFSAEILSEIIKSDSPDNLTLLQHTLEIIANILTPTKTEELHRRRGFKRLEDNDNRVERPPSLCLDATWTEIMMSPHLLPLMFQTYWKVRDNDQLATHAMSCLCQLASLHGEVLPDECGPVYLKVFVENFLQLVSGSTIRREEALGIANITLNIRSFFDRHLSEFPKELQVSYYDELTRLTCCFIEGAVLEESTGDTHFSTAMETIFRDWHIHTYLGHSKEFVEQAAVRIFDTYVQFHVNVAGHKATHLEAQEEVPNDEDNDRIKYCDQLQTVGLFARLVPDHSLTLLYNLLENRITQLTTHLEAMFRKAMTFDESLSLDRLFEDIHWIVLIAGHTVYVGDQGQINLIPPEINRYSMEQCIDNRCDLASSLKTLSSMQDVGAKVACIEKCDKAIRIFANVMKICFIENMAYENKLGAFMSPEVGCTLMWFLKLWCSVYLLPPERNYDEISPALIGCMGEDTESALFTMNFLLQKVRSNVFYCKEEPILLRDTVDVLVQVVKTKSAFILKTDGLWEVVRVQNEIQPGYLPDNVRRGLYKAFVLAGRHLKQDSHANDYYIQILKPLEQKLKEILFQENFERVFHEERVQIELSDVLVRLTGVCDGCEKRLSAIVIGFLQPILSELPVLLGMYHNYANIVQKILELFVQTARCVVYAYVEGAADKFFKVTLSIVETYAKYNENRFSVKINGEEGNFEDLSMVMKLLQLILEPEIFDQPDERGRTTALCGFQMILPLISEELLEYPKLCLNYYPFLASLVRRSTEQVMGLSEDILVKILSSIELGLTRFGSDVVSDCLDFIAVAAEYVTCSPNSKIYYMLKHFLKLILTMSIMHEIEWDFKTPKCIYVLIRCYKDDFRSIVDEMVHSQTDPLVANRLIHELNELMMSAENSDEHHYLQVFSHDFKKFLANVHGLLLVK